MATLERPDDNNGRDPQLKMTEEMVKKELERISQIVTSQKSQLKMEKSFALQRLIFCLDGLMKVTPVQENGESSGYFRVKECELELYKKRVEQIITQLYVEKEMMKDLL